MDNRPILSSNSLFEINSYLSNRICSLLKEKYNKKFIVSMIGDRINTGHVKFFLHPEDDAGLLFTATMKRDGSYQDDFIIRKAIHSLDVDLEHMLYGIGVSCKTNSHVPVADYNSSIDDLATIQEVLIDNHIDSISSISVVRKGAFDYRGLYDALLHSDYGIIINRSVFVLSEENYDKCSDLFSKYPCITEAMVKMFDSINTISLSISNSGESDVGFDAFCALMEG